MKLPLYQIDAFAGAPFQGNPAAVCPLEEWLPDTTLQAIAEENNLSETVYYVETDGKLEIRWFTPVDEVDLCGHATLAAGYVYFETQGAGETEVAFESKSGTLRVLREGELLTLDFPSQLGPPCEPPLALVKALGATPVACFSGTDYMLVFESEAQVRSLSPDMGRLKTIDTRGVIVTAPGETVDFVSRFFAPRLGIDEDPVTGSAHCVMTPYWSERLGKTVLQARQLSRRSGDLRCELAGDRVRISGRAIPFLEGTITI